MEENKKMSFLHRPITNKVVRLIVVLVVISLVLSIGIQLGARLGNDSRESYGRDGFREARGRHFKNVEFNPERGCGHQDNEFEGCPMNNPVVSEGGCGRQMEFVSPGVRINNNSIPVQAIPAVNLVPATTTFNIQ
jgi:hypothetical protein